MRPDELRAKNVNKNGKSLAAADFVKNSVWFYEDEGGYDPALIPFQVRSFRGDFATMTNFAIFRQLKSMN